MTMPSGRRRVLLVQLPIPPLGSQPVRGNVPLAAGYLKLYARKRGLEADYDIDILPPPLANSLSDCDLVEAILARGPWLAGFTCYLWNIERTLWIAERLKERRPDLRIVVGGPEVTPDNVWVLDHPAVDFAVIGEGEQTFAELLEALSHGDCPSQPISGLYGKVEGWKVGRTEGWKRRPLPRLDEVSSPYLAGILDAADERMLLLETIRGCVFQCKFCYYPKAYDALYFLSEEKIRANLRHARERGVDEVVLLDPTLNQRRDFAGFLRLLIECNPQKQWAYFGELRAEGVNADIAGLLREANFTEVEIGLQSTDPHAQELMDRKNNLRAFERGVRALLDAGIRVKVDLIIGLPGDTPETVRRSMHYLRQSGLYTDVQVFHLSVLPGTAFRHEAEQLGLRHQPRPPYYVLDTPTLQRPDLFGLMAEARDIFEMDWDPLPRALLPSHKTDATGLERCRVIDLDVDSERVVPRSQSQAFTLWLRSGNFRRHVAEAQRHIEAVLSRNPFTTLQVILEPTGDPHLLAGLVLQELLSACHHRPTYLDRYYALQPGRPIGAKRLVVLLRIEERTNPLTPAPLLQRGEGSTCLDGDWRNEIEGYATLTWRASKTSGLRERAGVMA